MIAKALLNLDRVVYTLDPNFDPNSIIRERANEILQRNIAKSLAPTSLLSGVVDLKEQMDQPIDPLSPEIGLHSTPIVARNTVIVGAAHKSGGVPTGKTNVKGYIRGFDVRTGRRLCVVWLSALSRRTIHGNAVAQTRAA